MKNSLSVNGDQVDRITSNQVFYGAHVPKRQIAGEFRESAGRRRTLRGDLAKIGRHRTERMRCVTHDRDAHRKAGTVDRNQRGIDGVHARPGHTSDDVSRHHGRIVVSSARRVNRATVPKRLGPDERTSSYYNKLVRFNLRGTMQHITRAQRAAALLLLAFALIAVHACARRCGDLTGRAETAIDGGDFHRPPPPVGSLVVVEEALDAVIPDLLSADDVPGAVVWVGRQVDHGYQVWQKAYGLAQIEPRRLPMSVDAIFDLASLTKPIATGTSLMLLVERGDVQLDNRVCDYLPEFCEGTTRDVTVRQLMMHCMVPLRLNRTSLL